MGTIVKILGQEEVKKEKKKIEFVKCLMDTCDSFNNGDNDGTLYYPKDFENIELVCKKKKGNYVLDIMMCFNKDRNNGSLYLGYFNDGEV